MTVKHHYINPKDNLTEVKKLKFTVTQVGTKSHLFIMKIRCLCVFSLAMYCSMYLDRVPIGSRASRTCNIRGSHLTKYTVSSSLRLLLSVPFTDHKTVHFLAQLCIFKGSKDFEVEIVKWKARVGSLVINYPCLLFEGNLHITLVSSDRKWRGNKFVTWITSWTTLWFTRPFLFFKSIGNKGNQS